MTKTRYISISLIGLMAFAGLASAQSRRERREARLAESAKPRNVAGGVAIEIEVPYKKVYDAALNFLKRRGDAIDSADRDAGQVTTAMQVSGRFTQTAKRIQLTFIRDNESKTTVRVAVTEQKRKKVLQAEPWGEPKVNDKESSEIAAEIRPALAGRETEGQ